MNRRDILKLGMCVPVLGTSVTYADCRDERRIPQPEESAVCLDLRIRGAVTSDRKVGRAVFGFGAYEKLLEHHKRKRVYPFVYQGGSYSIRVARLSVDVNREIGCVICEVQGTLYGA
jgi:hypothetical protein